MGYRLAPEADLRRTVSRLPQATQSRRSWPRPAMIDPAGKRTFAWEAKICLCDGRVRGHSV